MWYEITKSYGCSRDNSKIKGIEIVPALSPLKMMHEKSSNNPTYHEYNCDNLELAMWMEMEHKSEFSFRNMNLQISKEEYIQKDWKTNKNPLV